jgi:mRNA-degrading endonuclease RelE of RelBE toxin-antitoxin system
LWKVDEPESVLKRYKKLGSTEKKQYKETVKSLMLSENPTRNAEFVPTRKHGRCWVLRLTGSYRLAYRVYWPPNKIIQLIAVGDHKEILGKDKHS